MRPIHPTGARRRTADDLPGPERRVRQRRTGAPPSSAGGRLCRPEGGRWHMLRRGRGAQLGAARAAQDNVRGISLAVPPVPHGWQLWKLRSAQLVAQLIGVYTAAALKASSTCRAAGDRAAPASKIKSMISQTHSISLRRIISLSGKEKAISDIAPSIKLCLMSSFAR